MSLHFISISSHSCIKISKHFLSFPQIYILITPLKWLTSYVHIRVQHQISLSKKKMVWFLPSSQFWWYLHLCTHVSHSFHTDSYDRSKSFQLNLFIFFSIEFFNESMQIPNIHAYKQQSNVLVSLNQNIQERNILSIDNICVY